MSNKVKSFTVVILTTLFVLGISIWGIASPDKKLSESERRPLAQLPEINISNISTGKFMKDFESYSMDQFPAREGFRAVKSITSLYLLMQNDVNGIYNVNGNLSKIEFPENDGSKENAAAKFRNIYDKYVENSNSRAYLCIIPDKNYFMAKENGYPSIDYNGFISGLADSVDFAEYIDITDCLELDDYYKTDSHWRQEKIIDVAERIALRTGTELSADFAEKEISNNFHGVYLGQSALPIKPEKLIRLENNAVNSLTVFDYETNKEITVYNDELANGKDPYEMFLSGSKSLLKITNPNINSDKRLIVFRDSFGSSLAPLLATGYSEVYLVDIRYISSEILGNMIDFDNSDVLFLYSTLVLNNSITLK